MGVEVGVGVGVAVGVGGVGCDVKQLAKVVQVPLIQYREEAAGVMGVP